MKTIGASLQTHLEGETTTLASCWKITRRDGTIYGFTDHDDALTIDGQYYYSIPSYTGSDVQTTSALNVDNMDVVGILNSPAITEDDLRAGLWDHASIEMFQVNWADLTMGRIWQRVGWIGEVKLDRGTFKAELRGLTNAYTRVIGELTSAQCRATFGDARCGLSIPALPGLVQGVAADNVTFYDSRRYEIGRGSLLAITQVTNADPCVITTQEPHGFAVGQYVAISNLGEPALLNVVWVVQEVITDTQFSIDVNTSDTGVYPPYSGSGGSVMAAGSDAGYFDRGTVTFTSGQNIGLSMEVRYSMPGQVSLMLPMPYQIAVDDAYEISPGCDKLLTTCRDRYNNIVNFRGEPYLPGIDKMVQVGRRGGGSEGEEVPPPPLPGEQRWWERNVYQDRGGWPDVAPGYTAQGVDFEFLDLPGLGRGGAQLPSFFFAAAGDTDDMLSGFAVYRSRDGGATFDETPGNYVQYGANAVAIKGVCTTILGDSLPSPAPPDDIIDIGNTLDVQIGPGGGVLTSNSNARAYMNVINTALVGNEIIQFRSVASLGGGAYRLSNLYRGAWGTEYAMATHVADERFVLLNVGEHQTTIKVLVDGVWQYREVGVIEIWDVMSCLWPTPSNYNRAFGFPVTYKVVPAGMTLAEVSPIQFTLSYESIMPFCPANIEGVRDGSDNLTITWLRRSPMGSTDMTSDVSLWHYGTDVGIGSGGTTTTGALSPGPYDTRIKIYASGAYATVKRTVDIPAKVALPGGGTGRADDEWIYTAAMQVEDFGSTQASVYMAICETKPIYRTPEDGGPSYIDVYEGHPAKRTL